jgi:hypothetical protein
MGAVNPAQDGTHPRRSGCAPRAVTTECQLPFSDPIGKDYALELILRLRPRRILDVGPGSGTYGRLIRERLAVEQLDAVEIWAPYIEEYQLRDVYDNVFVCDARLWQDFAYDLVILGDVLEHLSFDDAVSLWRRISAGAEAALLSLPVVPYPQDAYEGNPYETHLVPDWTMEKVLDALHGIQEYREMGWIGVFLAVFEHHAPRKTPTGSGAMPQARSGMTILLNTAHQTAPATSVAELLQRDIPIFVPAFENPTYVRNMIDQLTARHLTNIIVVDNASSSAEMRALLDGDLGATVVRLSSNRGPRHILLDDDIYFSLPPLFCVTDPDLELNPELPNDFLAKLVTLTERFQIGKAGFSLDISEPSRMRQERFDMDGIRYKITEWEQQFWTNPVGELDGIGTIYRATIDTTFAVYNKKYFRRETYQDAVRVAGSFTCRHLPWYLETDLPEEEERMYRESSRHSFYQGKERPKD